MWKHAQIADASTTQLLVDTQRSPQTLYELHGLAELARRAACGEARLDDVLPRVVAACSDRMILFGAPPGYLAANVLATADEPVRAMFWRLARRDLDPRSFAALCSHLRDTVSPPNVPLDEPAESSAPRERWLVQVYGAADEPTVVAAVQSAMSGASLVEHWSDLDPLVWVFDMPAGSDAHVAMSVASAVAGATGAPVACDAPASLGALAPNIVAFCRPGRRAALGTVVGDTASMLSFTRMEAMRVD